MSRSFASTFPPRSLADVFGNSGAVAAVRQRFDRNQHETPLLIYGPDGVGKGTIARLYAKALLCEEARPDASEPCNHCGFCEGFDEQPGFGLIDLKASQIGEPRKFFADKLRDNPLGHWRVVIVRDVEKASAEFLDTLLKPMEEGRVRTTFILLTEDLNGVRAAGQSRCMVVRLRPLDADDARAFCKTILRGFKVDATDSSVFEALVAGSRGLPERAVRACRLMQSESTAKLALVSRVLDIDWGDQIIAYFEAVCGASPPSSRAFSLPDGVSGAVMTGRVRAILTELHGYLDPTKQRNSGEAVFQVLNPIGMRRLAARFQMRASEIGIDRYDLWRSLSEIYLSEDFGDAMGFESAGRVSRGLFVRPYVSNSSL